MIVLTIYFYYAKVYILHMEKHIPLYDKNLLLIIYVNNVSVKCERQHLFIKNPVDKECIEQEGIHLERQCSWRENVIDDISKKLYPKS